MINGEPQPFLAPTIITSVVLSAGMVVMAAIQHWITGAPMPWALLGYVTITSFICMAMTFGLMALSDRVPWIEHFLIELYFSKSTLKRFIRNAIKRRKPQPETMTMEEILAKIREIIKENEEDDLHT